MDRTAEESWECFLSTTRFIPFRDASAEGSPFELYILDCLKGLAKALQLGWFSYNSFDPEEYDHLSRVENGGLNWIIPKKLLAFSAPANENRSRDKALTPERYCELFRQLGVGTIIRLNKEHYDPKRFTNAGFSFYELYFLDGSVPPDDIANEFLRIVESQRGAVAVHCKAGLGRTATLIGIHAIKNYGFAAAEFIGWARLCRPGSVLGPQQFYLCEFEESLNKVKQAGKAVDMTRARSPQAPVRGEMTLYEKHRAKYGEMGQSERLTQMKSAPSSPIRDPVQIPQKVGLAANLRIPQSNIRNHIKDNK